MTAAAVPLCLPTEEPKVELMAVPWEALWQSSGVVSLGGDAVEDINTIYDV